jgi:SpoVK/Ycf46/Vps4 family AAA+-type ATPase
MPAQLNPDLYFHLRSLSRLIYFVTEEEDRTLVKLAETLKEHEDRVQVFNAAFGMQPLKNLLADWSRRTHTENAAIPDIHRALIQIYKDEPLSNKNFYVITDAERWLVDPHVQRRILNIIHQLHADENTVKILFFISNKLVIPSKLQRYIEVVHDRGLTEEEYSEEIANIALKLRTKAPKGIERYFKGLTSFEVDAAIAQSVVKTRKDVDKRRIDPKYIGEFKRRQLNKTDLLNYVDVSAYGFDQIGGVKRFKAWAEATKACWTEEGAKFGLEPPKGVLAVGVWGCGKSLSVKALGNAWRLPVVSLEMGRLRSSGVGESEANVYRAINLIESVAPCVTGETEVTLANGMTKSIEALWQEAVSGTNDLSVMCWNEKSFKVEATRVSAVTHRRAEAFRVEAANGFYLNATANHEHYVMRGGMPEWARTDELLPGDMLAVATSRYDGDANCRHFFPKGMRIRSNGASEEFRRGGGGFRDAVVSRLPESWTPDLGWLLGIIEGDGFIGVNDGIGLTNTTIKLLDNFERILGVLFDLKATRNLHEVTETPNLPGLSSEPSFKPCWTSVVTNQLAAEFLREARKNILAAPAQVRAAFFAGWVDADGCVGHNKVTLTVKSPKMWLERQLLGRQIVQSLGVVPSKFEFPAMEVTGTRAVALAAAIGEFLVEKDAKAARVSSSEIGFDRGMGFACGNLIQYSRLHSHRLLHREIQEHIPASTMWKHEHGLSLVSERHMKKYAEVFKETEAFQGLLDASCRWVQVTGVTSVGEQDVYDLACEGADTHSFLANGLVTHNCIVWIDEAEKSLAGNQSSANSDAGTTARTIGILSTWLQETKSHVCLAMTANSLKTLPVEFVNRIEERFFFDLPNDDERIEILKIHLTKKGQDPAKFQLAELAEAAKHMVGREIEQAIKSALRDSFQAGKEGLDGDILIAEMQRKPRIFKTMVDELREVLEWVGFDPELNDGIRAKFASDRRSETFKEFKVASKE